MKVAMLLELSIKDFAIIDRLHLQLDRHFNVFTGETGAGKSIIIDAVNALLGGKIGAEFVRSGSERATVEGVFSLNTLLPESLSPDNSLPNDEESASADSSRAFSAFLREYGIMPEDQQVVLTRDIFRSGRTVARINGRTYSQPILQQVASWLVDIHGQSEHLSLLRTDQHINFLDRYAELLPLRDELSNKVNDWRATRKKLQSLQQDIREQERRAEFLRYEIEEIEKAQLRPGEVEELEDERKVLNNAERLRELCTLTYGAISGSDNSSVDFQPALDQLRQAQRALSDLVRLDRSLGDLEETLSSAVYQLEDVSATISSYETDIEDNPARLADIEERLDLITRLKRKYGTSIEEILQRLDDSQRELDQIANRDELIGGLQEQDSHFRTDIGVIAGQLSQKRSEAAKNLASAMENQLNDLNMRRARFLVDIAQSPDPLGVPASIGEGENQTYACDLTGIDHVQFLIAPNPGEPFKPLTRIASGGETSRLMLALKTILTSADATPTLIFDEIDSGISGRSGQVVGEKLWQLTRSHQVICVTHLPQIAAFADAHYNVSKQIFEDRTITIVHELRQDQRIREIAHIMGGNISEFAQKSAQEMLERSQLWKENWQHLLSSSGTTFAS